MDGGDFSHALYARPKLRDYGVPGPLIDRAVVLPRAAFFYE